MCTHDVHICPLPKYASGNGICNHVTNTHPVTNPRSPTSCRNNSRIRNKSLIHNAAEFDVKNWMLVENCYGIHSGNSLLKQTKTY